MSHMRAPTGILGYRRVCLPRLPVAVDKYSARGRQRQELDKEKAALGGFLNLCSLTRNWWHSANEIKDLA